MPTYAFDLKNYWLDYEGDWLLIKGDTKIPAAAAPQLTFLTTCLQHRKRNYTHNSTSVVFSSRLGDAELNTAVRGHLVNGMGLCPSSVYADVAFTAAWYIASRIAPSEPVPAMDFLAIEVSGPFIVDAGETTQVLKVSAYIQSNERAVEIAISSRDTKGSQGHARCTVQYGDGQLWMQEWQKNAYLVQARMDQLVQPTKPTVGHRLLKEMIYKQFQTVVTYSKQYHNIDELFMNCDLNESVANIRFQPTCENDHFTYSPYWIETVAHLGGVVLNASVNTPADTVFMSHGWESFRIAAPLAEEKPYKGYVRMQPTGSRGVMAGDAYIFDGGEIVVLCKGLKFQQMKRTALHSLLGSSDEAAPAWRPKAEATKHLPQCPKISTEAVVASPAATSGADISNVLATIATEVGVNAGELTDDAKISDFGVDSLLTITILGRLRKETGLDLPNPLFVTYPAVAQLKVFFLDKMTVPQSAVNDEDSDASSYPVSAQTSQASNTPSSALATPPEAEAEAPDAAAILLSIIAHEVGIDSSEILPTTRFSDIGVDSLLTISNLDAFKTQMGINLSAVFFQENPTVADVQRTLGIPKSAPQSVAHYRVILQRSRNHQNRSTEADSSSSKGDQFPASPYSSSCLTVLVRCFPTLASHPSHRVFLCTVLTLRSTITPSTTCFLLRRLLLYTSKKFALFSHKGLTCSVAGRWVASTRTKRPPTDRAGRVYHKLDYDRQSLFGNPATTAVADTGSSREGRCIRWPFVL